MERARGGGVRGSLAGGHAATDVVRPIPLHRPARGRFNADGVARLEPRWAIDTRPAGEDRHEARIAASPRFARLAGGVAKNNGPIVPTSFGKAFSTKGLGNKMADAIDAAGLSDDCAAHGLRKAAARRLAEAGCSPHEIASITGHKSLAEVERHTRAVEQRRHDSVATSKLAPRKVPPRNDPGTQTGEN